MSNEEDQLILANNYIIALRQMTTYNKYTIGMLTQYAESVCEHGIIVVKTITKHIAEVCTYSFFVQFFHFSYKRCKTIFFNSIIFRLNQNSRFQC